MKNIKMFYDISKIIIVIISIPFWFVKMIHYVAVLPSYDSNGNFITVKQDHYFSIIDNLRDGGNTYLIYIAFGIIVTSLCLSIVKMFKKDNKVIKIASNITFALFIVSLVITLMSALSTGRGF